jgi:hypothetical protein
MGRPRPRRVGGIGGFLLVVIATAACAPASVSAAVTPITDCRAETATPGVFGVYYGYVNTGAPQNIEFGPDNQMIPGFGFQGQPVVFNTGSYPRVLTAIFNSNVFSAVAWEVTGTQAVATVADTPLCAAGATGPVSDLATDAVTLHGLVDPNGADTAYHFEYGPTIAYGRSTPERHVAGTTAQLVGEPISGLGPGTTYHYRLVADGTESTVGEDRAFTTRPAPPPPQTADLLVTRTGPAKAKVGRKVSVTFTVANAGPAAATGVSLRGHAADGLRIASMSAAAGDCPGGRDRDCSLGTIAAGGSAEVRMRIAAKRRGRLDYWADAIADQPEARPADNLVTATLRGRR